MQSKPLWFIEFYTDHRGCQPVKEFLDGLQPYEKAQVKIYLDLLYEFGIDIDQSHAKPLVPLKKWKPLWELTPGPVRIIYYLGSDNIFWLLHAFRKKSNETKREDLNTAMNRYIRHISR